VLQQPENTITTRASAETQELAETLTTTTSHRSRPKVGGQGRGGAAGVGERGGGGEEGLDLDPHEKEEEAQI
jgi:hypothetical protein